MPRPGERVPIVDRVRANSTLDAHGCWLWTGVIDRGGYGRIEIRAGIGRATRTRQLAHRVSYEAFAGPIPAGLTLDHLCRNRSCVNPGHLEPVDGRTNTLRGETVSAQNARKTHCPRGHAYEGPNLRLKPGRRPQRVCRTCSAEQKRHARQRSAA